MLVLNCRYNVMHYQLSLIVASNLRTYLIVRAFDAKEVILQIAASPCKLEQTVVVVDGPVQVRHGSVG